MWESSALPADWPAALNRRARSDRPDAIRRAGLPRQRRQGADRSRPGGHRSRGVRATSNGPTRPALTTLIVGDRSSSASTSRRASRPGSCAFAGDPDARLIVKTQLRLRDDVADDAANRVRRRSGSRRAGSRTGMPEADVLLALGQRGLRPAAGRGHGHRPAGDRARLGGPGATSCADAGERSCCASRPRLGAYDSARVRPVRRPRRAGRRRRRASTCAGSRRTATEAREMGRAASHWAARERNIWDKGPAVLEVMERARQPPRPLRRTCDAVGPSWRTPCGVAEYTAHLARAMPPATGVRVAADAPDLAAHARRCTSSTSTACTTTRPWHGRAPWRARRACRWWSPSTWCVPIARACERDADVLVGMTPGRRGRCCASGGQPSGSSTCRTAARPGFRDASAGAGG